MIEGRYVTHPIHLLECRACGAGLAIHDERPIEPDKCPACESNELEPTEDLDGLRARGHLWVYGPNPKMAPVCRVCSRRTTRKVLRRSGGLCATCEKADARARSEATAS